MAVSSQMNVQLQPLMSSQNGIKSSRSGSAGHAFLLDLDDSDELGGPLKLSRKELYGSCRQSDISTSTHWVSAGGGNGFAILKGANSFCMDDPFPWSASSKSQTNAYNSSSDESPHTYFLQGDPRVLPRTDSISPSTYACSPQDGGLFWPFYIHQYNSAVCGNRSMSVFTSSQRVELEDQALIFKYMMTGTTIPPHLLVRILKSLTAVRDLSSLPYRYPSSTAGWANNFYPSVASNPDPEPGRCRRTDGKKWRCAREAVPDQKYCDRHIHRGRNRRSRKLAENHAVSSTTSSPSTSSGVALSSLTAASSSGPATAPSCPSAAQRVPSALERAQNCITQEASITAQSQHSFSSFANRNLMQLNNLHIEHDQQFLLPFQSTSNSAETASLLQANGDHNRYENGSYKGNASAAAFGSEETLLFSELRCRNQSSPGQDGFNRTCTQNRDIFPSSLHAGRSLRQSFPHSLISPTAQDDQSSPLAHRYCSNSQHRNDTLEFCGITNGETRIPREVQKTSNFLGNEYGAISVDKETASEQPLRHFFDDWPRNTRDPSCISWMDQSELGHEKSTRMNGCGTQLSISISTSTSPSPATSVLSPSSSRELKSATLPPLTLSMSRPVQEEILMHTAHEQTQMKLGLDHDQDPHRHLPSLPMLSWVEAAPAGGPLAEMLQSSSCSTPAQGSVKQNSGLNLLCEGWESPRGNRHHQLSSRSSPSAVLQAAASAASNGSCCSSPAAHACGD